MLARRQGRSAIDLQPLEREFGEIAARRGGRARDFALWDIRRPAELCYALGANPCAGVVHRGRPRSVEIRRLGSPRGITADARARMKRLNFEVQATASGSRARAGRFRTLHNEVLTPVFMPVGTHAAVRSQRREDLIDSGAQVLLANTYHLLLRPGVEIFEKFGGIHGFMSWPRSVLTDSGGFQIFSLPGSRTMREDTPNSKATSTGAWSG